MKVEIKRYLVLVCGILIQLFVGIIYIWSIFQEPVRDYFGWSYTSATVVFSIMLPMNVLGVIVGGVLSDKRGVGIVLYLGSFLMILGLWLSSLIPRNYPELLYVFYAGMCGAGGGLAYNATVSCAQKWWLDKKGMASGIIVCAYGMSTVVFAPLINVLLQNDGGVGVPGTFRVLAIIFFVIILLAGWLIRDPKDEYAEKITVIVDGVKKQKQYKPIEVVKSKKYYLLLLSLFCLTPAYLMLNTAIKSLGELKGLSEEIAVMSVMITGLASALGRLLAGALSDQIGSFKVMMSLYITVAISVLLLWKVEGDFYIVLIALISCVYGGCAGVTPILSTDSFGTKYMSTNFGLIMVSVMISGIVHPVVGSITYLGGVPTSATFLIPFGLSIIGGISVHFLKKLEKR